MNRNYSKIIIVGAIIFVAHAFVKAQTATGGSYTLDQSVIASSGGTSTGTSMGAANTFFVSGTIGQSAAGTEMSGADYSQFGGFWTALASVGQIEPPAISVSFSPASVTVGEVSTLTIALSNPSANTVELSGVGVANSFPAGLAVDEASMAVNTCDRTFSVNAAETSIALIGETMRNDCYFALMISVITVREFRQPIFASRYFH